MDDKVLCLLIDYNNEGDWYLLTVSTTDEKQLFEDLHLYSNEVRFIEYKEAQEATGRQFNPTSKILGCKYFGSKLSIPSKEQAKILAVSVTV